MSLASATGSSLVLRSDDRVVRAWTAKMMLASAIVHALLIAWLVVVKPVVEKAADFTEITLLEPGDLAPAPAPVASAGTPSVSAADDVPRPSATEQHFVRERPSGDVQPLAASASATLDRIATRLASLHGRDPGSSGLVTTAAPSGLLGSPTVATGPLGGGSTPIALARGGGNGTAPALRLARGGASAGSAPAIVATGLPSTTSETMAPARGGETSARRSLAGALLMGPVADRPVLQHVAPVYPEWAKRDAVEGSVTLYFVVRPDGSIRENVLVQKTAGFEEFDDNARAALRAWRFQPLTEGRTGEQWGTITFHFRLREGSAS